MKKLVFLSSLFVFASVGNLQANRNIQTITEGGCTYTTDTFSQDGNIYEIIVDAISSSPSVPSAEACASRPVGRITFKAKEGITN